MKVKNLVLLIYSSVVVYAHSASIDVNVSNANGSRVSNAKVKLSPVNQIRTTDANGYVRFAGLSYSSDAGVGSYSYEVYYDGTGIEEFWGSDEDIWLEQALITRNFTRDWPFKSSEDLPDNPLVGQAVTLKVVVKNNLSYSRNVKVKLWVDRSKTSSWDYEETSSAHSISGSGGTKTFTFNDITPSSGSKYYWKMSVLSWNDGAGAYIETDTSDWELAFDPFYSDVDISVKDIHGSYFQGAVVELDGDSDTTDSSGEAQLDASYGTHTYEVFYGGAGGREFWCSDTITVNASSESETIQRNWPYKSGESLPSSNPDVGDSTSISVTVKNKLSFSRNAKVELWVDRDQNSSWDYHETSSAQSISGYGGTKTFTFNNITPSVSGQHYWKASIHSYNDGAGEYILTDSAGWKDAFDVPPPPQPLNLNGRIAYHSYSKYLAVPSGGDSIDGHLFVYDAGSDSLKNVTASLSVVNAMNPHFSPDGSTLVFMGVPASKSSDISYNADKDYWHRQWANLDVFVYNLAIETLQNLTPNTGVADEDPKFSPDGQTIVWKKNGQIWRMGADGSNPEQLTSGGLEKSGPNYSPNGSHIVYWVGTRSAENEDVWRMSADGSSQGPLVENVGIHDYYPIYRDAENILYARAESESSPYDKVYNYNIDSGSSASVAINLTGADDSDASPVNETYVTFCSTRSGSGYDVFVGRYDNGLVHSLPAANSSHEDLGPSYSQCTYAREVVVVSPSGGQAQQTESTTLVTAKLWSDGTVWSGASPKVTLNGPITVEYTGLKDDGTQGDITSGDGVYSKTVTLPSVAGSYTVVGEAESVEPGVTRLVTSSASSLILGEPHPGTVLLSSTDYSVNESDLSVDITVIRQGGDDGVASVNYATANGSAIASSDYTAQSGTFDWGDGDSSSKTITIPIIDDSTDESDEKLTVQLSDASGVSLGLPLLATITIFDDDESGPAYTLSVSSSGASGVVISSSTGHEGTTDYQETSLVSGSAVSLTAPATSGGKNFSRWSGDIDSATPTISFAMDTDKTVTVHYVGEVPELPGAGTELDPYLLSSKDDLLLMASATDFYYCHFRLTVDIDLAGEVFDRAVISPNYSNGYDFVGTPFTGVFDGNDHVIQNVCISNLTAEQSYVGFFGMLDGSSCSVKNLKLENLSVSMGDYVACVGGLSGCCGEDTSISNCHINGKLVIGDDCEYIGGFCGFSDFGLIVESSSSVFVMVDDDSDGVGSFIGANYSNLKKCYSSGIVSVGNSAFRIGGLCGGCSGDLIEDCYSSSPVTAGNSSECVGGLCGAICSDAIRCYSIGRVDVGDMSTYIGGLIGGGDISCPWDENSILNLPDCFWDIHTSGQSTSFGGVGKTTDEMQSLSTFTDAGWDFVDTWYMRDYPRFIYQKVDFEGSGTEADPYLISTKEELLEMVAVSSYYDKYFQLVDDIDLAGETFSRAVIAPNGTGAGTSFSGTPFTGEFDGNGYVIRNVSISTSVANECFLGLFGKLDGAQVMRLGVENISITDSSNTSRYIGGVCGQNRDTTISECYVDTISIQGGSYIGGFCGLNSYSGNIHDCFVLGNLSGSSTVGGFCGYHYQSGSIENCYAVCTIASAGTKGGFCAGADASVAVTDCFWDTSVSGLSTSSGGIGKTTAEMQQQSNYVGWDFVNNWYMNNYPLLICHSDVPIAEYVLTVQGGTGSASYRAGVPVGIVAGDPPAGQVFKCWVSGPEIYTNSLGNVNAESTVFTMPAMDVTLTALYADPPARQISITGPSIVNENSDAQYIALLSIEGAPDADVTTGATWNTDQAGVASVVGGLLSVGDVVIDTSISLIVSYTEGGVTTVATQTVAVIDTDLPGSGTYDDPYLIAAKIDLLQMAANTSDYDKYFKLISDIDFSGESFNRALISPNSDAGTTYSGIPFSGVFDGNGHVIRNVAISTSDANESFLGLFGKLDWAEIYDLGVENVSITDSSNTSRYIGGLCGQNSGAFIIGCYVDNVTIQGGSYMGGFCGLNSYNGEIYDCYATGTLSGSGTLGGFCGYNYQSGLMENCYAVCSVTSAGAKGGFCAGEDATAASASCYWDTDVSSLASSSGGMGKTTTEMQTQSTFVDWDFGGMWYMASYPELVFFMDDPVDDVYEPNNTLQTAFAGLSAGAWLSSVDGFGIQLDEDWYKVDLTQAEADRITVDCNFSHAEGDIDIALFDGDGNEVAYSETETDNEYMNLIVPSNGVYYISVYYGNAGNVYDLRWDNTSIEDDNYETNNTLEEAYSGLAEGVWLSSVDGFGVQADDDWYQISMLQPGYQRVEVECTFSHGDGDIDIALFDEGGNELVYPWTETDNEYIDFVVPSNGIYYILVFYENAGNEYDLRWDTSLATYDVTFSPGAYGSIAVANSGDDYITEVVLGESAPPAPGIISDAGWVHVGWSPALPDQIYVDCVVTAQYALITSDYSGGAGSELDPYVVSSVQDLRSLSENVFDYDKHFILTADIDLNSILFSRAVIAPNTAAGTTYTGTPFSGVFDGNGHIIRNVAISISGSNESFIGLVGKLNGAEIKNLGVENITITDASNTSRYIGGFCGQNSGSVISKCYVDVVALQGGSYMGGFCGLNSYSGSVSDCYVVGYLTGSGTVGGFCGYNYQSGTIGDSYATCSITSGGTSGGFCSGADATGSATGCFWDTTVSGLTASSGGTGKTTTEMQVQATYSDWDFTDIWCMDGYPALNVFGGLSFASWLNAEAVPLGQRGESDIPMNDGVPNLLKYACGFPAMTSVESADVLSITSGVSGTFSVLYYKSKSAVGVTLEPIWATNLSGPWLTTGVTKSLMDGDAQREQWKASVPLENSGFIKLRATAD